MHVNHVEPNGERWPSATDLIGLIDQKWKWTWYFKAVKKWGWRGWQYNEAKAKRGKTFGQDVHGVLNYMLAERFGLPLPPPFSLESSPRYWSHINDCAHKIFEWIVVNGYKPVLLEQHLVSKSERIHGTPDGIFECDGRLIIVDYKTSDRPSDSWVTQLAIYALLGTEHLQRPVQDGMILNVNKKLKTPRVMAMPFKNLQAHWPIIRGLRQQWTYWGFDRPCKTR